MIIDLLSIWTNKLLPEHLASQKQGVDGKAALSLDDKVMQSSFEFPRSPSVRFVRDIKNFNPVDCYDRLPEFDMTARESEVLAELLKELKEDPKFFDGDQLLVTNMVYDDQSNIVFIEAKRAKYSFLRALALRSFPEDSDLYKIHLYKTGVMSPFITTDDKTFFLERSRDKLYSAVSGFLEPKGKRKLLNPKRDLVVSTALKEILEEVLGTNGSMSAAVLFYLPKICSLSIRQTKDGLATAEFIAPTFVNCHSRHLQHILRHNTAKDRDEHTDKYAMVDLDPSNRDEAIEFLKRLLPGSFLYSTMLVSAARVGNYGVYGDVVPERLPCSKTSILPLYSLSARFVLRRKLSTYYSQPVVEKQGDVQERNKATNLRKPRLL